MDKALIAFTLALLLSACSGTVETATYTGPQYPETVQVEVLFQPEQVQPSCRVFAELFAFYPAQSSGQSIAAALTEEARARGAEVLLVGQSREASGDAGASMRYFGPPREYAMDRGWSNWSSGYSIWKKQGRWVNLGLGEWGKEEVLYEMPLAVQAALLRCN